METWDAIRARRNVREFADRPVPEEALDRMLEAGRRSPSASNWQPWDFVAVTDRADLERLATVWEGSAHIAGAAAAIAFVSPIPEDEFWRDRLHYDLGQATMAMMIVAADLGIGCCHTGAESDLVRPIIGFPEDRICLYLMSLGYPLDRPLRPLSRLRRRTFDEVVHRGRW
jgi:nitroreductase